LATKELAAASQQAILHFHFQQGIIDQRQHDCHPPLTLLFCVSPIEDDEGLPFCHN
jgi:hypothetical protein